MKLEVVAYDEDEGVITLDMDNQAQKYLIELGFNQMLRRAIDNMLEENENGKSSD